MGLIADSHGDTFALSKAIDVLGQRNISELIHLGDFFDSVNRGNLYEVWSILQKHQVLVVKGNNDYHVEKMLDENYGYEFQEYKETCLAFLKKAPIFFVSGDTCFSHSMPCNTIRAFYEPIDNGSTEKATEVFEKTPYRLLFCGHSHNPVFFRYRKGNVTRERIAPGRKINIDSRERFIFIVGAAENGECGLYDIKQSFYERIVF